MTRTVLAALIALIALPACAGTGDSPAVTVHRVVDGDTLEVRAGSTVTPVRLIGVDTPETGRGTRPAECFGAEATAFLTHRLPPSTPVTLLGDDERRDRYGRLLAYVLDTDGALVNLELVTEGYAVAFPFAPNDTLAADFAAGERRAATRGIGLWRHCGGADTPVDSVTP